MALPRDRLLRTAFRVLAKQAQAGLFGEVQVLFRGGVPYMTRIIRQHQLEREHEVDGVDEAELARILANRD